jgi:hypothetical protein
MDLRRYASVVWRFRIIVAAGLVLAIMLALLSVVRVSSHGLTYRDSQLWSATMKLKVTQSGCPECRLYAQRQSGTGDGATNLVSPKEPVVDPARLATLAIYYSQIITSDAVRTLADRGDGVVGKIIATPDRDAESGVLLPYIDVLSIGTTANGARLYADRTAQALSSYISAQQRANNVAPSDRAVVQAIVHPRGASVYRARPKTMAIVVFLAVMFATIGLALVLENARPRKREVDPNARSGSTESDQDERRSA